MIFCLSYKKTNDINPIDKNQHQIINPIFQLNIIFVKKMKSKFVSVKEIGGSGFL